MGAEGHPPPNKSKCFFLWEPLKGPPLWTRLPKVEFRLLGIIISPCKTHFMSHRDFCESQAAGCPSPSAPAYENETEAQKH